MIATLTDIPTTTQHSIATLRLINWQLDEEAARTLWASWRPNQRLEETTLGLDCTLLCTVTDKNFGPPMNPAQICLRPANHEDVPFLLELRRKTMNAHLLASGLIPSLEEDMRRVLLRLDCAQIILLANQPVGLLGFGTRLIQSVLPKRGSAGAL